MWTNICIQKSVLNINYKTVMNNEQELARIVELMAYQQLGKEQSDDLYIKMGILNEYGRKLLISYINYRNKINYEVIEESEVDEFLKNNNDISE